MTYPVTAGVEGSELQKNSKNPLDIPDVNVKLLLPLVISKPTTLVFGNSRLKVTLVNGGSYVETINGIDKPPLVQLIIEGTLITDFVLTTFISINGRAL